MHVKDARHEKYSQQSQFCMVMHSFSTQFTLLLYGMLLAYSCLLARPCGNCELRIYPMHNGSLLRFYQKIILCPISYKRTDLSKEVFYGISLASIFKKATGQRRRGDAKTIQL